MTEPMVKSTHSHPVKIAEPEITAATTSNGSSYRNESYAREIRDPLKPEAQFPIAIEKGELNFVSVFLLLLKYRVLVCAIIIMATLLGTLFAVNRSLKYEYSTVIELGRYAIPDAHGRYGAISSVEPTSQASIRLSKRFIASALLDYSSNYPESPVPKLIVDAPEGANIIEVYTEAREQEESQILDLLAQVSREFMRDHEDKTNLIGSQILLSNEQLRLSRGEVLISQRDLAEASKLIQAQQAHLEGQKLLLQEQVVFLDKELLQVQKRRDTAIKANLASRDTFGLLLFDNDLLKAKQQRDALKERLVIHIPDQQARLIKQSTDLSQRQQLLQDQLKNLNKVIERSSTASAVELVSEVVSEVETSSPVNLVEDAELVGTLRGLDLEHMPSLQSTTVVVPPNRSVEPSSLSSVLLIVISFLGSVILAVSTAVTVEFFVRVKKMLRRTC